MGTSPTAFSGSITRSAFEANLADARDWANSGIVAGDIDAASIERAHIYRPDTQLFPKRNSECVTQQLAERQVGRHAIAQRPESLGTPDNGRLWVARSTERINIFTEHLLDGERWPIAQLACRLYLPVNSFLEISCNWEAVAQHTSGSVGLRYPASAGRFRLRRKRLGSTVASFTGSLRNLNAAWSGTSPNLHRIENMHFTADAQYPITTAGVWDFWLEYDLNGATTGLTTGVMQVIIPSGCLTVEVQYP